MLLRKASIGLFLLLRPALALYGHIASPISLTPARDQTTLSLVEARLAESANYRPVGAKALLEWRYASINLSLPVAPGTPAPTAVTDIATAVVRARPANTTALFSDGSAGDPCAVGVAVLLADATIGSAAVPYAAAAQSQLQNILTTLRTPDGAISHRVNIVELWSDFVYMAPPFIAYYGAQTNNFSLLQQAYDQCRLYRQYFVQPSGLWGHIALGNPSSDDPGTWNTGNGWAAMGMLRVAATIERTGYAKNMTQQVADLFAWTNQIVNSAWPYQQSNASGMLRNYIDQPVFADASGSALLAAAVYRLAALGQGTQQLSRAESFYNNLPLMINSTGWLAPVVNPLNYPTQGSASPEGQAFVLMLESARRDYNAMNTTVSADAPPPSTSSPPSSGASALAVSRTVLLLTGLAAILCRLS